jgi:hypothetical protein
MVCEIVISYVSMEYIGTVFLFDSIMHSLTVPVRF